eukprot:1147287-Pelagomonas_calceolata.AAC.4
MHACTHARSHTSTALISNYLQAMICPYTLSWQRALCMRAHLFNTYLQAMICHVHCRHARDLDHSPNDLATRADDSRPHVWVHLGPPRQSSVSGRARAFKCFQGILVYKGMGPDNMTRCMLVHEWICE